MFDHLMRLFQRIYEKKKYKKDNFFFIGKHFPTLIDLVFYVLLNFPKNF